MREFLLRCVSFFFIFTLPALIITLNLAALHKANFLSIAVSILTIAASSWSGLLLKEKAQGNSEENDNA